MPLNITSNNINLSLSQSKWIRLDSGFLTSHVYPDSIDPIIARLLFVRNIHTEKEIEEFFLDDLSAVPPENLIPDIELAAEIIIEYIKNKNKIRIFGDYDADGITSTALMVRSLLALGANVDYFLPHRLKHGYGLNKDAIKIAKEEGIELIITVDNGTSSFEEIDYANELGLKIVVTDHHEAQNTLPKAAAVVNPKRLDSSFPFRETAGVGVAFLLLRVICQTLGYPSGIAAKFLDLVAIGTIADSSPLIGLNRILVKNGLKSLSENNKKVGIAALIRELKLSKEVNTVDVAFKIAPKINAAGRVDDPLNALELLLTKDTARAVELTKQLFTQNEERISLEQIVINDAVKILEKGDNPPFTLLYADNWHLGVVGIAASRISEKYFRPSAILVKKEDGVCKGSLRTYGDFDLFKALDKNSDLLLSYGGHSKAAGLTIKEENIPKLHEQLNALSDEFFKGQDPSHTVRIDTEIELKKITLDFAKKLLNFEPYGMENEVPFFLIKNVKMKNITKRGCNNEHISMTVCAELGVEKGLHSIWFGAEEYFTEIRENELYDIVCTISINCWQNTESVQLIVKDMAKKY